MLIIQASMYGREFLIVRRNSVGGAISLNIDNQTRLSVVQGPIDLIWLTSNNKLDLDNNVLGILYPAGGQYYGDYGILDIVEDAIRPILRNITLADKIAGKYEKDNIQLVLTQDSNDIIQSGFYKDNIVELSFTSTDDNIFTLKAVKDFLDTKGETLYKKYEAVDVRQPTLESLEAIGYNLDWYYGRNDWPKKDYIPVHTKEDIDMVFEDLKNCYEKWIDEGRPRNYFLVTIDYESDGTDAFINSELETVFLGISFQDHKAYGIFIDMDNFDNVPIDYLADRMNRLFGRNLKVELDDDIRELDGWRVPRKDLTVTAHNKGIDIRFGLKCQTPIDVWIDLCSIQLAFNFAPNFVRGNNGAKDRIEQVFGIKYADIKEMTGDYTYFRFIKDKDCAMVYGCADVDLVRLYTYQLIDAMETDGVEVLGCNLVEKYFEFDRDAHNIIARMDYKGIRVDLEKAQLFADNAEARLNAIYEVMSKKFTQYKAYKIMELQLRNSQLDDTVQHFIDLEDINYTFINKWSGDFLVDVLFKSLGYPTLVMTQPKTKWNSKTWRYERAAPKPALDKDALNVYLDYKNANQDIIDKYLSEPVVSIEHMKIHSMYLQESIVDPVQPVDKNSNPNYLINKDDFNSYRYPFIKFLQVVGPLVKDLTADYNRVLKTNGIVCEETKVYRAATRRLLNGLQTLSKDSKELFIGYREGYNIIGFDQATVEVRIASAHSKDLSIIKPLQNWQTDPHRELASSMYNKPPEQVTTDERKGVKPLNFGRMFDRSVFSMASDFFGSVSSQHLSQMARLVDLYDITRVNLRNALAAIANRLKIEQDIPEKLKFLFMLDKQPKYESRYSKGTFTDRKFAFTQNSFGFPKWVELIDEEPFRENKNFREGLNIAVQGDASTCLRPIVTDLYIDAYRKGLIEEEIFMPHLTVHDEVQSSYDTTRINPIYLTTIIADNAVINFDPYDLGDEFAIPLFIGVAIANNWKESKTDAYEIPMGLVIEWQDEVKQGMHRELILDKDHTEYIAGLIKEYKIRMVVNYLTEINKEFHGEYTPIWYIDEMQPLIKNYTYMGYMFEIAKPLYKVQFNDDPIEVINSILPAVISKYMTDDKVKSHVITSRNKVVKINKNTHTNSYKTEEDLYNGLKDESTTELFLLSTDSEDYTGNDVIYDFNTDDKDDYISVKYPSTYENKYFNVNAKDELVLASFSQSEKDKEVEEANKHHYSITNGSIFIKPLASMKWIGSFLDKHKTTRVNQIKIYLSTPGIGLKYLGSLPEDKLLDLEKTYKAVERKIAEAISKNKGGQ